MKRIYQQFPALQSRNYRLYFYGQLISFTGSWLHGVAHGWLTYSLTHSAFWLGAVTAVSALPVLILSLYGGLLVDRINRKKLLIYTQGAALVLAFLLGFLTLTHHITLPVLLLLTFLAGIANAIDNPATQAFVVDIVKKEDLPSAIGLNATMFNTGRVLGPAAAGFLIALVGIGNIFLINAASFLAILISLYFISSTQQITKHEQKAMTAIKEGIEYSASHPLLSRLLLTAGVGAIFCFSQATIMPVLATKVFDQGSQGLGILLSAMGVGALAGSLTISSQYKKVKASIFIMYGGLLFLLASFAFSCTSNLYIASVLLVFAGFGLTVQFSSLYSTIQKIVKEEYRGRVSSIYVLLFVGISPLGNLLIGSAATWWGPQEAIRFFTIVALIYGALMYIRLGKIKLRYHHYLQYVEPVLAYSKD